MNYHINSKGVLAPCTAVKGNCPFGEGVHYSTEKAGNNAIDKAMAKLTGSEYKPLTDKQYEVAKAVGLYNKSMMTDIAKRDDLDEAIKALDSEEDLEVRREMYRPLMSMSAESRDSLSMRDDVPIRFIKVEDIPKHYESKEARGNIDYSDIQFAQSSVYRSQ